MLEDTNSLDAAHILSDLAEGKCCNSIERQFLYSETNVPVHNCFAFYFEAPATPSEDPQFDASYTLEVTLDKLLIREILWTT